MATRIVEIRESWAIQSADGWVLQTGYFNSPPPAEANKDGLRTLLFSTRAQARKWLPRARATLKRPRVVKVTIKVTL